MNMKNRILITAGLLILTCMAGCGDLKDAQIQESATENFTEVFSADNTEQENQPSAQPSESQAEIQASGTQQEGNAEAEFSFADLADTYFYFSSGAGGWYTELSVNSDGTFGGIHEDSDMGDTGEAYPNGTLYFCDFAGRFDQLERVDAFTWKMKLVSLTSRQEPGMEEIIDGVRYIYSPANGMDGGEDFYLYLPGAKLADLPEDYLRWVGYYNLENTTDAELTFYGIYNEKTGDGFSSYKYVEKSLSEKIAAEVSYAEARDEELMEKLQNVTTQDEMNVTAQELLQTWDDTLNIVWKLLEAALVDEQMEALRAEERTWIDFKEEEVNAVGREYEGGSIQPMEMALKGAELTKKRVYELEEYGNLSMPASYGN